MYDHKKTKINHSKQNKIKEGVSSAFRKQFFVIYMVSYTNPNPNPKHGKDGRQQSYLLLATKIDGEKLRC